MSSLPSLSFFVVTSTAVLPLLFFSVCSCVSSFASAVLSVLYCSRFRTRTKISGTAERPRLCVYRSNKNLFVQVIDDVNGTTLAAASTLDKEVKNKHANSEAAKEVGALIAKRAQDKKIKTVVFDRSGYLYHGIIKDLAEAAREAGLEF